MIQATVVADSISLGGVRLTTLSLTYPRFILPELNTHRLFSRNSASSRAIPTAKLIDEIRFDPAMPVFWGRNQPGMQASQEMTPAEIDVEIAEWQADAEYAIERAEARRKRGLHKQLANRPLEPFMHARTVLTATEWSNFYTLRRHKDAQPEIKALADVMWDAMEASKPEPLKMGEWHIPYATKEDALCRSIARCARVSYMNHEGKQTTYEQDLKLAQRLSDSGHWSPFEHQATPASPSKISNNFRGWLQLRDLLQTDGSTRFD